MGHLGTYRNPSHPEVTRRYIDEGEACIQKGVIQEVATADYFKGKSLLFGVRGAFTPVCSNQHLPSFVANYEPLKWLTGMRI